MRKLTNTLAASIVLIPIALALLPARGNTTILIRRAASASCGSALISSDSFTEAGSGNIALNTHTKDTGNSWTTGGGTALGMNDLSLDRTNDVLLSTASATNGAAGVISDGVTCFNYTVQADMKTGSTGTNRVGVLSRFDITTGNGYFWRITGSGTAELYRDVAGSADILLGSTTVTAVVGSFATGTLYTVKLSVNGSVLTASINGTVAPFGPITDTTYTTGKPGIQITNTQPRADNFSATYLP